MSADDESVSSSDSLSAAAFSEDVIPASPKSGKSKNPAKLEQIEQQQPLALAFVHGEAVIEKPEDLYIPPDALEVILDSFEGPLDLLLYLIRRQKFDIVELPVLQITKQYMKYVEVMTDLKLELAGEYLLMAAMLAEIKSRLLLPKRDDAPIDEDDPRAELIRRLKEYEKIEHKITSHASRVWYGHVQREKECNFLIFNF